MAPRINCNEKRGRLFTDKELAIMHENYKELLAMFYVVAEKKQDYATLDMLEAIFL